jgi:hypothetical protein
MNLLRVIPIQFSIPDVNRFEPCLTELSLHKEMMALDL